MSIDHHVSPTRLTHKDDSSTPMAAPATRWRVTPMVRHGVACTTMRAVMGAKSALAPGTNHEVSKNDTVTAAEMRRTLLREPMPAGRCCIASAKSRSGKRSPRSSLRAMSSGY